jgi:hypothetical protein
MNELSIWVTTTTTSAHIHVPHGVPYSIQSHHYSYNYQR